MVQVRLWTLLGESQTGKSRSIKDLASRHSGGPPGFTDVLLRGGGYLHVFAKVMAWQENRKTPAQTVAEINQKIQTRAGRLGGHQPAFMNVLSALRLEPLEHAPGVIYPGAAEYLAHWVEQGWTLESLALLSPDPGGSHDSLSAFGSPTAWIYDSRELAVGQMVGTIRNHFGWA
jgi:hypothetical protein